MGNKLGTKVKLTIYTGVKREVFLNFHSESSLSVTEIMKKMTRRILEGKKHFRFGVALFYNNNKEIRRVYGLN